MPERTDSERLAVIEEKVSDMHRRLFGNGRPGEIDRMKEDIESIQSKMKVMFGVGSFMMALLAGAYYVASIAAKAATLIR